MPSQFRTLISSFIIINCVLFFNCCKKYDDGPEFTLLTKKMRVTGNWKLSSAYINGQDVTRYVAQELGEGYVWSIKSDGTYSENAKVNDAGIWKFIDNKEAVKFTSTDPKIDPYEYKIKRLTNEDLWLQATDQGLVYLLKLYQ